MKLWQPKRGAAVARLASAKDRPALAALLAENGRRFGPAAIEEQMSLLNSGFSSISLVEDRCVGFVGIHLRALAATQRWADVGMVVLAPASPPRAILPALIGHSTSALAGAQTTAIVCLTGDDWVRLELLNAHFETTDHIVNYGRASWLPQPRAAKPATLRPATIADTDTMLAINAAAFGPLWRYDPATTISWFLSADHCRVAEFDGQPAGFALTSYRSAQAYAQLIRIAVDPNLQGKGIGRQLVADAIAYAKQAGAPGLALNTQASNSASRHLYETSGFRAIGPTLDVLTLHLDSAPGPAGET